MKKSGDPGKVTQDGSVNISDSDDDMEVVDSKNQVGLKRPPDSKSADELLENNSSQNKRARVDSIEWLCKIKS